VRHQLQTAVLPTAAALAAAMGVGRFVYTPILPLMTAQAGLSGSAAGHLATANYVGYLLGAVATTLAPRLARSGSACRAALLTIVVSLAAMPLTVNVFGWLTLRTIAGFASAVVFVIAVNALLERFPQGAGWGFGGVGVGIAASAALVLTLPAHDWRTAWWAAAGLAAVLAALGWWVRPQRVTGPSEDVQRQHHGSWRFTGVFAGYTLEGVGYIIAGTFLVAAVTQRSPGALGGSVWLVVGLAVIPSAVLWARLGTRFGSPAMLTAALAVQAAGIALACQGSGAAALAGALLFGGTFIGVSTLATSEGRSLGGPGAVAVLTIGYSVGQIAGPLVVTPLMENGYRPALAVSALVVSLAALATSAVWIVGRQPRTLLGHIDTGCAGDELIDHRRYDGPVVCRPPHQ